MSDLYVQSQNLNITIPAGGWQPVLLDTQNPPRNNLRRYSQPVTFLPPLSTGSNPPPPIVIFKIYSFNTSQAAQTRVEILAEGVTQIGCTLVVQTWGDSNINSIGVNCSCAFPTVEAVVEDLGVLHDAG